VTNTGAGTTLTGSAFDDKLTGGEGDDTLVGGGGDQLSGGEGQDTFVGASGWVRIDGGTEVDKLVLQTNSAMLTGATLVGSQSSGWDLKTSAGIAQLHISRNQPSGDWAVQTLDGSLNAQLTNVEQIQIKGMDLAGAPMTSIIVIGTNLAPKLNHGATGSVTVSGIAAQGRTLTATNNLEDLDGLSSISYQWMVDGQSIDGATGANLTIDKTQAGKAISVAAHYVDGDGVLEGATSSVLQVAKYNTTSAENTNTVTTLTASDPLLSTTPKYTLTGADASLFKISTKGALTFATAKDYEQPTDSNHDGIYEVSVTMTNAKTGYKVVKDLTVGVEFTPILGTAGADTLKGTTGYDTLDGKAGDDKLTGGAGLDTFLVTSGRDAITDFNLLTTGATGSEILQVAVGATADATLKAAWAATANSYNAGTANILTSGLAVDLSAVTQGQGWSVTNTGKDAMLKGSQFNDVLTGGTSNDQLLGGAGNDLLIGGKGSDILTGGAGADTFRLGGDTKTDHITDFLSGTDRIQLDHLLYKALPLGPLENSQLVLGTKALTTSQHLVYDQPTGNLWYDADGSGKGAAVLIAVLDNHTALAYADLAVI
jgi:Ca2+-binding RTX toxin-like protein